MFSIRVEMCAPAPKLYPNEIILLFQKQKSCVHQSNIGKKKTVSCHDTMGALLIWIEVPGRKLAPKLIHHFLRVNSQLDFWTLVKQHFLEFKCEVLKGASKHRNWSNVTWTHIICSEWATEVTRLVLRDSLCIPAVSPLATQARNLPERDLKVDVFPALAWPTKHSFTECSGCVPWRLFMTIMTRVTAGQPLGENYQIPANRRWL